MNQALPSSDVSGKPRLSEFAANRYSQYGEDGILEKLFELIGTSSRLCVEFGAWDGFHLSNTANLWTCGWKGVLIEGHARRFNELVANTRGHSCVCIHAYVSREGPTSLEALLEAHGIHDPIDLLSIDIDGDDYHILASLDRLRPRVIVCEYNPTIPAEMDLYAEYGNFFGASVAPLDRVARNKGYRLVALTDTNCFFVLGDLFDHFAGFETRLGEIKIDRSLVHLITSYRGDYVLSRPLPYGAGFPYREALHGAHIRATFRTPAVRWLADGYTRGKRLAKRILRME